MGARNLLIALLVLVAFGAGLMWFNDRGGSGAGERAVAPPTAGPKDVDSTPTAGLSSPGDLDDTGAGGAAERVAVSAPEPATATAPSAADDGADPEAPLLLGRVVDRLGNAVAAADVFVSDRIGFPLDYVETGAAPSWLRRWRATTDEEGRFSLRGPAPGAVRVAVRATGFAPLDLSDLPVPVAAEHELDPLVLQVGAILEGRVVEKGSGRGVAGAKLLRLERRSPFAFLDSGLVEPTPAATTDAGGGFRVDQLAPGPWRLRVESEDHPDLTVEGVVQRPGEIQDGLIFRLDPGEVVAGRVTDVPAGDRGRLRVRAIRKESSGWLDLADSTGTREGEVARDGAFTVRGLEVDGEYVLQARLAPDGRRGMWWSGRTRSDKVSARAGDRGVVIAYQPEAAILFQVLDDQTGEPLTDFEVSAGMRWKQSLVGEDGKRLLHHPEGRVRIGDLRPTRDDEQAEFSIQATGFRDYERNDVIVPVGRELDLGVIRLQPIPTVRVTVLDDRTGEPIPGALATLKEEPRPEALGGLDVRRRVVVNVEESDDEGLVDFGGSSQSERTDEQGVAVLSSLEGRTCFLHVRHGDHAPATIGGLFLPRGQVVEREVRLTVGGSVVARVLDEHGRPLAGAKVRHRPPGAAVTSGFGFLGGRDHDNNVADTQGEVLFEHLEPGIHGFKLDEARSGGLGQLIVFSSSRDGEDPGWTEVDVADGATGEVTLHAMPRASLTGRVTEAGVRLAGAAMKLRKKDRGEDDHGMRAFFPDDGGGERTDGEGEYAIRGIEPGEHVLSISHPTRRMAMDFDVVIEPGDNGFDVDLPVSILEGRITDQEGKALAGLRVTAERVRTGTSTTRMVMRFALAADEGGAVVSMGDDMGGDAAFTDEDGRYSLRGVVSDVELVVRATGDLVQPGDSEPVVVGPDEVRSGVDFQLDVGGSILVEIQRSDGTPAQFCMVRGAFTDDGGGEGAGEPGTKSSFAQNGSTTLSGLRPGTWTVSIDPVAFGDGEAESPPDQTIEVEARETVELLFTLP